MEGVEVVADPINGLVAGFAEPAEMNYEPFSLSTEIHTGRSLFDIHADPPPYKGVVVKRLQDQHSISQGMSMWSGIAVSSCPRVTRNARLREPGTTPDVFLVPPHATRDDNGQVCTNDSS